MSQRILRLALLVVLASLWPSTGSAHENGIAAQGCSGCHGSNGDAAVSIASGTSPVALGQQITLTIAVRSANGVVAGFYLQANTGSFRIIDSGTKLIGAGVTHTQPRTGSGGQSTFTVGWVAPDQAGGVNFDVWGLSGNGDNTSRGDAAGEGFFSTAFGCGAGTKYFRDFDGDGFGGIDSGYTMNCSQPQYYAAEGGDCNDNDELIWPGAHELCDGQDNNCNGMIDEGLPLDVYCEDDDNDGHGVKGKATKMACGVTKGFGLCDQDCNDADPEIYPGAQELCNNRDDNCNDIIDEGAVLECGLGWCRRSGQGCASNLCTPGKPSVEECNDFDDDCDGVIDNGTDLALCGKPGLACVAGECVPSADAGAGVTGGADGGVAPGGKDETGATATGDDVAACGVAFRSTRSRWSGFASLLGVGLVLRRIRRGRRR